MEQTHAYIRIYIAQAWRKHTYTYVHTWSKHTYTYVFTLRKHGANTRIHTYIHGANTRIHAYIHCASMEQSSKHGADWASIIKQQRWSRLRVYHHGADCASIILHHTHRLSSCITHTCLSEAMVASCSWTTASCSLTKAACSFLSCVKPSA